ncbi:MAG: Crp/Fnr family transcriptional regulator, partial [Flavobacteriales bacterium]|nr:Crp/Fnr family transcriptional regulator [Flavobacteriales bacterium]
HVIILKKGKVKVYSFVDKEKEQILRLVSDDQILGHRSFGGGFKLPVSATTLTQCDLVYIPVDVFLGALKANNDFCFQFMMFFAEELKNSEQHIKLKGAKNLNQRVATAILDNVAAFGYSSFDQKTLDYTISRKEFANFSNTTYESIVRTLKKFSELGLLEIKGKNLKILDEKGLVKISTLNY